MLFGVLVGISNVTWGFTLKLIRERVASWIARKIEGVLWHDDQSNVKHSVGDP